MSRFNRILVVDDDAAVCTVTREMLIRLGYEVTTAASGQDALEYTDQSTFDLILLDVTMPKMSGADVYRALRQKQVYTNIVFMTGYSEDEVADLRAPRTSVLTKPFQMSKLKETVASMMV